MILFHAFWPSAYVHEKSNHVYILFHSSIFHVREGGGGL